jgi:hypothetical protein
VVHFDGFTFFFFFVFLFWGAKVEIGLKGFALGKVQNFG